MYAEFFRCTVYNYARSTRSIRLLLWVIGLGFRYCPHGQGTKSGVIGQQNCQSCGDAVQCQAAVREFAMRCAGFQVEGSKRVCTEQPEASASSATGRTAMV